MVWKKIAALAASAVLSTSLIGCAADAGQAAGTETAAAAEASAEAQSTEQASSESGKGTHSKDPNKGSQSSQASSGSSVNLTGAAAPDKTDFKTKDLEDSWGLGSAEIRLEGSSASSSADGVAVNGSDVTISKAGTYVLSGTLEDGCIFVEAGDKDDVQVVLNGASITNADGPAIYAKEADKVILTIAQGTENTLADGKEYDASVSDANAAVYADVDLSINGKGTLNVTGENNNGIGTKDDLKIADGNINVAAANNALKGKDSVSILNGSFTLESGGDAIQSDKDDDETKGWIVIDGGEFNITAGNDAIQSESGMTINGGTFNVTTNGGSENAPQKTSSGGRGEFGGMRPGMDGTDGGFGGMRPGMDGTEGGFGGMRPGMDGTEGEFGGMRPGMDGTEGEFGGHGHHGRGYAADQTGDTAAADTTTGVSRTAEPEGTILLEAAADPAPSVEAQQEQAADEQNAETVDPSASRDKKKPSGDDNGAKPSTDQDAASDASGDKQKPSGTTEGTKPSSGTATSSSSSSDSSKGIKAGGVLNINGGTFTLDCADDAVHTNGSAKVVNSTFTIATGDDAMHADGEMRVNADVEVTSSYEGIEGGSVVIEGGNISLKCSDDVINATSTSGSVEISGGTIDAVGGGDGIDSNGNISVSGGDITVLIRSSADNEAIDTDGQFVVTGGTIIYGGTGTGRGPGNGSTQSYVAASGSFSAGTEISLRENGNVIQSFVPAIDCTSIAFSIPGITSGESYDIYSGDTLVASATAGQGGTGMGGGMFGGGHRPGAAQTGTMDDGQRPGMADGTTPDTADGTDARPVRPGSGTQQGTAPQRPAVIDGTADETRPGMPGELDFSGQGEAFPQRPQNAGGMSGGEMPGTDAQTGPTDIG